MAYTGYIYRHWLNNDKNERKSYIGQTIQEPMARWGKDGSGYTYNSKTKFANAIRKYGWNSFRHEIIETVECDTVEELIAILNSLEKQYIEKYDSFKNGYNSTTGGDNYEVSDITRLKQHLIQEWKYWSCSCNNSSVDDILLDFINGTRAIRITEKQIKNIGDYARKDVKWKALRKEIYYSFYCNDIQDNSQVVATIQLQINISKFNLENMKAELKNKIDVETTKLFNVLFHPTHVCKCCGKPINTVDEIMTKDKTKAKYFKGVKKTLKTLNIKAIMISKKEIPNNIINNYCIDCLMFGISFYKDKICVGTDEYVIGDDEK